MNTKTQIALVVIASFVAFTLYQNMVVIPEAKLAFEKKLQQDKKTNYEACLSEAELAYSINWDSQCDAAGKKPNCTLAKFIADGVGASWDDDKKNCVTMYK